MSDVVEENADADEAFQVLCSEIVTAPKRPTLELLSNDGKTAQIGWKVEESEEVKSYTVLIQSRGGEIEKFAYTMQTIIDDMEPGCLYGVSVCAETGGGRGPYSEQLTFLAAPLAPCDVKVVPNEMAPENSVLVKFNDPDMREKDYVVTVEDLQDTGSDSKKVATKKTTACIGELKPGSLYKIYVQTRIECTRSGKKLMSKKSFCKHEIQTLPSQPGGLEIEEISRWSQKLSWGPTAGAKKYEVRWKSDIATDFVKRETADSYMVLGDLSLDSRYEVAVVAVNSVGFGKRSAPVLFCTAPRQPYDLKVESYDSSPDNTLVVSFVDPKPDNKKYRLVAQPVSGGEDIVKETERCVTLLESLIPGEKYNVYVVIIDVTTQKESEKTYHSGMIQTCPAEVTGLEVEILQDSCLHVSWHPLKLTPLRYQIGIYINGRDLPIQYTNKTSFTMSNLTQSATYRVMVAAENKAGCGKFCEPMERRTRPAGPLKITGKRCPANPSSALTVWVEDNDCTRKQYRVEARDTKNAVAKSVTTWDKYTVLRDLKSGTSYRINVVAIDRGLESDPVWLCQS